MTYKVQIMFRDHAGYFEDIEEGLSEAEAQALCRGPETSSSSCTSEEGLARTEQWGPWFYCYTEE